MKKIIKIFLIILIIAVVAICVISLRGRISRVCSITDYEKYNVYIKIPYSYESIGSESEANLFNLYNSKNGISIAATALRYDFWSSGDINARMDEYLKVMSAVNYESQLTGPKMSVIEETENKLGKVELELTKIDESNVKLITIIANEEIGNMAIEFTGTIENINSNIDEIEKIIDTIEIKQK